MPEASIERERMEYDVVIVGGRARRARRGDPPEAARRGPGSELGVCVIEKGSEVGAHILSGAVFEPRALDELIPDWRERGAPLNTPATEDRFLYLTENAARCACRPRRRCTITAITSSASAICAAGWRQQAEELGVEIYPGFAAPRCCTTRAAGCAASPPATWASAATASRPRRYTPGVELRRARDPVRRRLPRLADQDAGRALRPARRAATRRPTAIGIKELWEVDARAPPARPRRPHGRLAARQRDLWRLVPLSSRRPPGRGRLRRRARLREPVSLARSRNSSASRPIRRSARSSRAGGASPMARGRSTKAGSSRSRGSTFPAGR